MGKRKNRQPDVIGDTNTSNNVHSLVSSEEEASSGLKCPHVMKAVNPKTQSFLKKFLQYLTKYQTKGICPTCKKLNLEDNRTTEEEDSSVIWVCLWCANPACGRTNHSHAEEHFKTPHSDNHCLTINIDQWSIWCYECDNDVNFDTAKKLQEVVQGMKNTWHKERDLKVPLSLKPQQLPDPVITVDEVENQSESNNFTGVGGLSNLGNTCFFNAVLQCLAQTPYLVKVLEDLREPGEKFCLPGGRFKNSGDDEEEREEEIFPPIEGTLNGWGRFTSILWDTLTLMQNSKTTQTYNPSELLNEFKKKSLQCMDGGQHDSHELLRHLLELVRNEDLQRYQSVILQEIGLDEKTKRQNLDPNIKARAKYYGNQASARLLGPEPVFRGLLVSTIECLECYYSSQRTEPFLDLSLPVMADKPQPPALKRKNSGLKDNDITSINSILSKNPQPSKHQLKKEKKAARKNRKQHQRPRNNIVITNDNDSLPNHNSISEENQESNADNGDAAHSEAKEESDEDVDDNIEGEVSQIPEVIESGYSSEKTAYSSLTELAIVSLLNSPIMKTPFSEAETDECRSSPETENPTIESTALSNTLKSVAEVTAELSNLSVTKMRIPFPSPTRYQTNEGECSVQSCLNQFTALELMSGTNKVGCKACTAREMMKNDDDKISSKMICTPSTKQYLICQVPAVLILHLKRFQSLRFRGFRKVTDHVTFPILLDLAPVCKNHRKRKVYSLYGLVEHSGTLHGGHYVAYVKARKPLEPTDRRWSFLPKKGANEDEETKCCDDSHDGEVDQETQKTPEAPPGQWYYVSDSRIMKVDEETVLRKEAYLLFYERIL